MKIVHCAETIKGGIASYLRELLPYQRAAFGPDKVIVVIPLSHEGELPVPEGVRVVCFDDGGSRVKSAIRLAVLVQRLVRGERPEVVHIHSTFAGAAVRPLLAFWRRETRVVYCPHGWAHERHMPEIGKAMIRFAERFLSGITDAVICISAHEQAVARAQGIPPEKLHLVANGVAAVRPTPKGHTPHWPPGVKRVLFVGRFDRQKGVDVMAAAMAELEGEAHAMFVGGTVLCDGEKLSFPRSVTHVGWLSPPELEQYFNSADILVVPSRWEGFGLIAAEGMRAGLAVIATRVGGLPEVVEDGVTGLLIEPDSVDEIVNAIRKMDAATVCRFGAAGLKRFEAHFSMSRVHSELGEVYSAIRSLPALHPVSLPQVAAAEE